MLTGEHLQAIGIDLLSLFWLAFEEKNLATSHVSLTTGEKVRRSRVDSTHVLVHHPWPF
jgi:hypothetical protein